MTTWMVEARLAKPLAATTARRLRQRLAGWRSELAVEDDGQVVRLEMAADDVAAAIAELAALLAGQAIVGLTAMTSADWQRQLATPALPDLVGILGGLGYTQAGAELALRPLRPGLDAVDIRQKVVRGGIDAVNHRVT